MSKRNQDYKKLLEEIIESLKHTPEELNKALDTPKKMWQATKDMTKDEYALISRYVKSNLKEFAENYEKDKEAIANDPFRDVIAESIWQGLLDITDKTQIEWMEVFQDIEHKGLYEAGDVIGLGALVCEKCGHRQEHTHPCEITPCIECGNNAFTRVPLKP